MMERDLDREAIIIQQALRLKAPIPDKIAHYPELEEGLDYYLDIYLDLCSDKSVGFGEGPIPWSAMDRYARRYNIEDEEFDRLVYIIKYVDSELMQYRQKKNKREMKKK